MFPLWLAIIIIFYFLSDYGLWKLANIFYYCDSVQLLSRVRQASLSITNSQSLLLFTQYHCILIGQQKTIDFYITKAII